MPVSKHRCFQPVLHRNHETTSPSLQEIRLQGVQDRFLNGNYFGLWVFGWVANLILMRSSQAYMIIYELCHPNVCCPSIRCDSGDCCDNTCLQWAWLHLNLQPRWASDVVSWNQSRAGRKHPTTLALEPQLLTLFCFVVDFSISPIWSTLILPLSSEVRWLWHESPIVDGIFGPVSNRLSGIVHGDQNKRWMHIVQNNK